MKKTLIIIGIIAFLLIAFFLLILFGWKWLCGWLALGGSAVALKGKDLKNVLKNVRKTNEKIDHNDTDVIRDVFNSVSGKRSKNNRD